MGLVMANTRDTAPERALGHVARQRVRRGAAIVALVLVMAPLSFAAIVAFPLWDDASTWLLIEEQGVGRLAASQPDRPAMGLLWAGLAAPSGRVFWTVAFVSQVVLWALLGVVAARLWTILLPRRARYAPVVACLTVAPVLSSVQLVTANIALASLPSVLLAYAGGLVLLSAVLARSPVIRAAVFAAPLIVLGAMYQEYGVAVTGAMVVVILAAARAAEESVVERARVAALVASCSAGAGYAVYLLIGDRGDRPEIEPVHVLLLGDWHLLRLPAWIVRSTWHAVAGGFMDAAAALASPTLGGIVATGYGALVAVLLVRATATGRNAAPRPRWRGRLARGQRRRVGAGEEHGTARKVGNAGVAVMLTLALAVGLLPALAMGRLPWVSADGMTARFGLPVAPIAASLTVLVMLAAVRPRLAVVPVALVGLVAGHASLTHAWSAVDEARTITALSRAIVPHLSSVGGYTVAVIPMVERPLGPPRQWELTARIGGPWPAERRKRFWAYRYGGKAALGYQEEARRVFGERTECRPPATLDVTIRLVTRSGRIDRLLWAAPRADGSILVEDYCVASTVRSQAPMSRISSGKTL